MQDFRNCKDSSTLLYKVVDMVAVPYWSAREYKLSTTRFPYNKVLMERKCPFVIIETFLDKLAIISSEGRKGISNLHGYILLPCSYDRVEIATVEHDTKVCDLHFIARKGRGVEIFLFDGAKALPIIKLDGHRFTKTASRMWKASK